MRNPRVAYRYAKALIDIAMEGNQLDVVKADIDYLRKHTNEELNAVMRSPVINGDKKSKIFAAVFHDQVSAITETFFNLLFRKGREFVIRDIADSFHTQYNLIKNIVIVTLTSSVPLTDELQKDIFNRVTALPRFEGKTIQLIVKTDPEIIGGFILELNDNKFDASIRHDLQFIKREFLQNLYQMKY